MSSEYEKPKISIVVPVYNKAKYISRTLDSLCTQTLFEIEIICVDDASSDNSLEIIHQYADTDSRIKVISFSENHTANTARKAGVMQANGEYIMLMDADDTLRSEACESLYEKMNNSDIDILNFGIDVINCGAVSEAAVENAFNFLSPFLSEIFGTELFVKAVDEEVCGGHALWNKIYRNALLKTAFEYVEDLSLLLSEDLYVWFIIAYFAKSYKGISDVLYDYYYGLGVTGHHRVDLTRFEKTLIDSKILLTP